MQKRYTMSRQTKNIRGLYSGDVNVGQTNVRNGGNVTIDNSLLSVDEILRTDTFPAADFGKNPTINLQTGRVLYRTNDAAIGANSYAISVSHVYNSQIGKYSSCLFPGIGNGWKLNLQQVIIGETVDSNNANTVRESWLYIDADGNTHEYRLFDDTHKRYYATDDATNVLTEYTGLCVIEDGIGNNIVFTLQSIDGVDVGLITKSVSCKSAEIVKHYEYDSQRRLVKVYDGRKMVGGKTKSYIELKYDDVTELLVSVTAYDRFNKKLSVTRYEYIDNRLARIYVVALNKGHQEVMSKLVTKLDYASGKLLSVVDCETKSAMEFAYDNERVSQVMYGVVANYAPIVGQKDSANQTLECGSIASRIATELFVCKRSQEYSYNTISAQDKHVYQTDVFTREGNGNPRLFGSLGKDENDIVGNYKIGFAYFMNRAGEVVSKFEVRPGNRLFTLDRDVGKIDYLSGKITSDFINSWGARSGTEMKPVYVQYQLARNEYEKKATEYEVFFNLRHSENCPCLKLKCNYAFETSDGTTSKGEKTLFIDGTATKCWIPVAFQMHLPTCPDKGNVYLTEFVVTVSRNGIPIEFQWDYLRYRPGLVALTIFQRNDSDSLGPLDESYRTELYSNFVAIVAGKRMEFDDANIFMTDADIQKSYSLAQRAYGKYDIVYNFGKCRACDCTALQANHPFLSSAENLMDRPMATISGADGNLVIQRNKFESYRMRTISTFYKNGTSSTSTSEIAIDYDGKKLYDVDEYGVRTEYKYDRYGNLIEAQRLSSDKEVIWTKKYLYDEYGEYLLRKPTEQNYVNTVVYNDFNLPCETELEWEHPSGEREVVGNKVATDYSLFNDKVTRVTEYNGSQVVRQNTVTYQDGRARTVTDGTITNSVVHDYVNDIVDYGELYPSGDLLVQRNVIDAIANNGKRSSSTFVEMGGNTTSFATVTDAYDRVVQATDVANSNRQFYYRYDDAHGRGSYLSKKVGCITNNCEEDFCERVYSIDADNNVVGWTDSNANHKLIVRQVSPGRTKYTFDDAEDIFTEIVYDPNVTQSPRIVQTSILREPEQQYDRPDSIVSLTRNYTYDKFGNVQRVKDGHDHNGIEITYNYTNSEGLVRLSNINYSHVTQFIEGYHQSRFYYRDSCFYDNGRISSHLENLSGAIGGISYTELTFPSNSYYNYYYDNCGRLTRETSLWGNRSFSYVDGRLYEITDGDGTRRCTYYNGRLQKMGNVTYSYDLYGNRTNDNVGNYFRYSHGNVLIYANGAHYRYNHEGVRIAKVFNSGEETRYYVDGHKILGEDRNGKKIRYFYDAQGICGLSINGSVYNLVRNVNGDVAAIVEAESELYGFVAWYTYDAWGKCTVRGNNGVEITNKDSPAHINPFRWKSLYLDDESGLYYANGSYYDPKTALYVDAADISTVEERALTGHSLDRTTLLCNNTLEFDGLPHAIYTVAELTPDWTYDINQGIPWYIATWEWVIDMVRKVATWYRNIPRADKIVVGLALLAAAVALTVHTQGGFAAALPILVQFAVGVAFGVAVSAFTALVTDVTTLGDAVLDALADGIFWGGVFAFVSAGTSWLKAKIRSLSGYIGTKDGVNIYRASQADFTDEAWSRMQSLNHAPDGSTISSLKDGSFIHKGFKAAEPVGKEFRIHGRLRADFLDEVGNVIYELKPNNTSSIARGIAQLNKYNSLLDNAYKMVLIVY